MSSIDETFMKSFALSCPTSFTHCYLRKAVNHVNICEHFRFQIKISLWSKNIFLGIFLSSVWQVGFSEDLICQKLITKIHIGKNNKYLMSTLTLRCIMMANINHALSFFANLLIAYLLEEVIVHRLCLLNI